MKLSPSDKARFLIEATRGPDDCFALRSFDPGREQAWYWRPVYMPVNEEMAIRHMRGEVEIGAYAMVPGASFREFPKCWWIVADFDGKKERTNWERDASRFISFISGSGCTLMVNRSRSGQGVHVRALFREPVPGWMARRWMNAWLEESGVVGLIDDVFPSSFDRVIPLQDELRSDLTYDGHRRPGNLVGSPMHRRLALANGGTLPISVEAASDGDFEPDGRHWEHLVQAVESRAWGEAELRAGLADAPGSPSDTPPTGSAYTNRALTVLNGNDADVGLLVARRHCEFFRYFQEGGQQPYGLWVALATQLHHFGEAGRAAFHELSALDPRYKAHAVDQKWDQTAEMHPIKCETLVVEGWRCPHLGTRRCNGAKTPAYFPEHANYEPL